MLTHTPVKWSTDTSQAFHLLERKNETSYLSFIHTPAIYPLYSCCHIFSLRSPVYSILSSLWCFSFCLVFFHFTAAIGKVSGLSVARSIRRGKQAEKHSTRCSFSKCLFLSGGAINPITAFHSEKETKRGNTF